MGDAEQLLGTTALYELGTRACADLAARAPGDDRTARHQTAAAQKLLERLDGLIAQLTGVDPAPRSGKPGCLRGWYSRIAAAGGLPCGLTRGGNGKRARTPITRPMPAGEKPRRYSPRAAIARTRKRSCATPSRWPRN